MLRCLVVFVMYRTSLTVSSGSRSSHRLVRRHVWRSGTDGSRIYSFKRNMLKAHTDSESTTVKETQQPLGIVTHSLNAVGFAILRLPPPDHTEEHELRYSTPFHYWQTGLSTLLRLVLHRSQVIVFLVITSLRYFRN
jgi:hypothetical protein